MTAHHVHTGFGSSLGRFLLVGMACVACGTGCRAIYTHHAVDVSGQVDQSAIKSLAVLEFQWARPVPEEQPKGWSYVHFGEADVLVPDAVAGALLRQNRYRVQDRSELEQIAVANDLQLSELIARKQYARIGKLANVDAIVVGDIRLASAAQQPACLMLEISFSCRCVSIRTGDIYWSIAGSKTVHYARKVAAWIDILAAELVEKLEKELSRTVSQSRPSDSGVP